MGVQSTEAKRGKRGQIAMQRQQRPNGRAKRKMLKGSANMMKQGQRKRMLKKPTKQSSEKERTRRKTKARSTRAQKRPRKARDHGRTKSPEVAAKKRKGAWRPSKSPNQSKTTWPRSTTQQTKRKRIGAAAKPKKANRVSVETRQLSNAKRTRFT